MTAQPPLRGIRSRRWGLIAKWALLLLLPLLEIAWLSVRVDTAPLSANPSWWLRSLGYSPSFLTALLAVAGATVLAFWSADLVGLKSFSDLLVSSRINWVFLLAHIGAFVGFGILTIAIVEGPIEADRQIGFLAFLLWVGQAATVFVLWCGAAAPLRSWAQIARSKSRWLAVGLIAGLAAWAAGLLTELAWLPLLQPTFSVVEALLGILDQQVISIPEEMILGLQSPFGTFTVEIIPSCSGYQGIGLFWVLLGLYVWLDRWHLKFPAVLLLFPIGTVLIWFANAIRIALLILVGGWFSGSIALGGFHSQLGWLTFLGISLGTIAVAQSLGVFTKEERKSADWGANATVAYLAPFLMIVATGMLTAAFSSGFDWLYPVRVSLTALTIWFFWRSRLKRGLFSSGWTEHSVGAGVLVFGIWLLFDTGASSHLAGAATAEALGTMPIVLAATWIAFRFVGAVLTAPIAEELAFRGYLTRRLIREEFEEVPPGAFTWMSLVISSVLFGALHGRFVSGTLAGMVYAWVYYRRGRVADAIVAHAVTNALLAAYIMATGSWFFWE